MREFPCKLLRIINGNTIEADFDLCFGVHMPLNIRLFGVDSSNEAMLALNRILPRNFTCKTDYNRRGKAGRCLGYVVFDDANGNQVNLNNELIALGFALQTPGTDNI